MPRRDDSPFHSPEKPALANLLTPKATAIAGFTFAVLSMLAQSTWSTALTMLFWGSSYSPGTVPNVMAVWGVGSLVMAALGALLAMLTIIGGLVHGV